jgi:hypothetical protein
MPYLLIVNPMVLNFIILLLCRTFVTFFIRYPSIYYQG